MFGFPFLVLLAHDRGRPGGTLAGALDAGPGLFYIGANTGSVTDLKATFGYAAVDDGRYSVGPV